MTYITDIQSCRFHCMLLNLLHEFKGIYLLLLPSTHSVSFRLQYVEAVLAEVMRLNTVAPVAPAHRITEDTTLGGYNIPKVCNFHRLFIERAINITGSTKLFI